MALHKEKRVVKPDAEDLAQWGEQFENITRAFYSVKLRLLGKGRHVGVRSLPRQAGQLYDSALFHLWGFMKRPKARFNYLTPGLPAPEFFPEVMALRKKLQFECQQRRLDFDAFNYTFAQRHEGV